MNVGARFHRTIACVVILRHGEPHALLASRSPFPRPELFHLLSSLGHGSIDAPGQAFHNVEWPGPHIHYPLENSIIQGKIEFMRHYKFAICTENSMSIEGFGYNTEKLPNALESGAVPVYWGDGFIDTVFNPKRYIRFNGTDLVSVARTVNALMSDSTARAGFFAEPILECDADRVLAAWCNHAAKVFAREWEKGGGIERLGIIKGLHQRRKIRRDHLFTERKHKLSFRTKSNKVPVKLLAVTSSTTRHQIQNQKKGSKHHQHPCC